jgi:hypothetical protein
MLKRLFLLIVISHVLLTTGCIAIVVGAGAGAGAFAYFDGQLSRTYEARYETTHQVCQSILKDLKQPILEEKTDGIQTTVKSERTDGTPMTIKIRIIDPDWTEVSVRTGFSGVWKKEISEQFHEFIAERIKK